jgi:hypothetical protein
VIFVRILEGVDVRDGFESSFRFAASTGCASDARFTLSSVSCRCRRPVTSMEGAVLAG